MSQKLFQPGFVYPSDHIGPYTELKGIVVDVDPEPLDDEEIWIKVDCGEYGILTGYTLTGPWKRRVPKVGYKAKIRVYRQGGGFYTDDRIIGWEAPEDSV